MKVLLVNPPDRYQASLAGDSQINFEQHESAPPIGLMYLKGFLGRESDAEVSIFNFQTPARPGMEDFAARLRELQPDLVGITTMTAFWYSVCETAQVCKATLPGVKVALGGPHLNLYPRESLQRAEVDFVAVGEGERTLLALTERLERGEPMDDIPGLWHKRGGEIIEGPERRPETDPDVFPFPDRSDFDPNSYRLSVDQFHPAAVVLSSRGCPQRCTFCLNSDHLYRVRRASLVADEVEACLAAGYRSIDFYDDNFNQSRRHVVEICKEFRRRKILAPWSCRCRADRVDEELVRLMAESGCKRIHFGVESASDRILKQIKKGITSDQAREAFRLARKYGIGSLGYFIIGFPGETEAEARETLKLALELDPDYMMLFPLMPLPGTEIYEAALKAQAFGGDYCMDFVRNPTRKMEMRIWETAIPRDQLLRMIHRAYLRFYLRPRFLFRILSQLQGLDDFFLKARMGFRLLLKH